MSAGSITRLTRRFKMGATVLDDPDPSATVEQVLEMYAPTFPHLRGATIGEPTQEGDELIYVISKPAVQTKGARSRAQGPADLAVSDTLDRLEQWASNPAQIDGGLAVRWTPVARLADEVLKRPAPAMDGFLIPLA